MQGDEKMRKKIKVKLITWIDKNGEKKVALGGKNF